MRSSATLTLLYHHRGVPERVKPPSLVCVQPRDGAAIRAQSVAELSPTREALLQNVSNAVLTFAALPLFAGTYGGVRCLMSAHWMSAKKGCALMSSAP